jgi:hypothetical protein
MAYQRYAAIDPKAGGRAQSSDREEVQVEVPGPSALNALPKSVHEDPYRQPDATY